MKTPEEIAAEVATEFPGLNKSFMKVFQGWIAEGIKRDREQRAEFSEAAIEAALVEYHGSKRAARMLGLPFDMELALRAADEVRRQA